MKKSIKVSVILPTFNEANSIGQLLEALLKYKGVEVIVVDDGSTNGTRDIVESFSKSSKRVKLLKRPSKMGLGSAYRDGYKLAEGEIIVEMDADLSHRPEELLKIINALSRYDVVIGSRYTSGGRIIGWPLIRHIISRIANVIANFLLRLGVKDATSGYRAYKRKAFDLVYKKCKSRGFSFQIESLHMVKRSGLSIGEIPITFIERKGGKSKLNINEIIEFLTTIFKALSEG